MRKALLLVAIVFLPILLAVVQPLVCAYATEAESLDVLDPYYHQSALDEMLNPSTAYSANVTEYDRFVQAYFDNLTYNIGVNYKGSCGYVAMAMLLSYYDSFLNDDIVPEQYDVASVGNTSDVISRRNSPGILRDIIDSASNSDADTYYSTIVSMSNVSLHGKLISIGASLGYYDFNDNKYPCSTNFNRRLAVLNYYLSNVINFDGSQYSILSINHEQDFSNSDAVRKFAIEKVKSGIPVLLAIDGNGGHVVVAYDYDESTDSLYCHFGWGANKTHVTPESEGFSIYKTALIINWNISHTHSNNFGVTTTENNVPTTEYYCYDSSNIRTYNAHIHSFIDHRCVVCYEYSQSSHYYHEPYTWISNEKHRATCGCGKKALEGHAVSNGSFVGGGRYATCLQCGGKASIGFIIDGPWSLTSQLVTVNGSYILPNGVVVLVDEDIEPYLNGSLTFFEKNTDSQLE